MIRQLLIGFAVLCATSIASAQKSVGVSPEESGADEVVMLWNNATAPHSNGITEDEEIKRINNKIDMYKTSQTDLYIYKADPAKATGQGVLIVPGGGYRKLSMKYDGFMVAQYLRSIGISCIIVKYRLPNSHREVPLEDAQEALRYLRKEGVKWGVDPAQVGILGSSAGGYLAAHVSTVTPDEEKPAFSILIYPVITGEWASHRGTFANMLGKHRTSVEHEYYSLENRVTPTTPPAILLLSDDDLTVPPISSILYYEALRANGVPATMHIYPSGGHGWAGHDEFKYSAEAKEALVDWLKIQNKNATDKKSKKTKNNK